MLLINLLLVSYTNFNRSEMTLNKLCRNSTKIIPSFFVELEIIL